jgi:hypothetical protein
MKTTLMAVLALTMVLAFAATPLLAAHAMEIPTAAITGCNGPVHGAFANVNGNFGLIGTEYQGAPNYHGGVVGQEPGATGYNNSTASATCNGN